MKPEGPQSPRAQEYRAHVADLAPKSPMWKNCIKAFFVGGAICTLGQVLTWVYTALCRLEPTQASAWVSITLVFLGATFTGLGWYDELGKFAGAGSIVPITGFANSVVAPAMEFKHEGYILGTGAKIFTLAGPVLVYGISASVLVGLVKIIIGLFVSR
ncbi:MAG: stage V sporulation protein AC [Eubacteriales bacterium]|nr:stage V sporulation protein AC [Eubacteriales bacterium]